MICLVQHGFFYRDLPRSTRAPPTLNVLGGGLEFLHRGPNASNLALRPGDGSQSGGAVCNGCVAGGLGGGAGFGGGGAGFGGAGAGFGGAGAVPPLSGVNQPSTFAKTRPNQLGGGAGGEAGASQRTRRAQAAARRAGNLGKIAAKTPAAMRGTGRGGWTCPAMVSSRSRRWSRRRVSSSRSVSASWLGALARPKRAKRTKNKNIVVIIIIIVVVVVLVVLWLSWFFSLLF